MMNKMSVRPTYLVLMLSYAWYVTNGHNLRKDSNDGVIASISDDQMLRGTKVILPSNDVIYSFLGIRYALAPTGQRRFAEPVPANKWSGVIDALIPGPRCPQSEEDLPPTQESEDCLFLNVYTPNINESLPVMLWIHGGGFDSGAGIDHDGSSLAAKDVVVVTINYRLGLFGFFSTGDDIMPGNYGMLDQIMALKWVQSNIHAFGGDPGRVTIFGQSSGAACVSLLILSPLTQGLFIRAIMQSGSSLSYWAVERPGTKDKISDFTKATGRDLGCNQTDSLLFLQCLRTLSEKELLLASWKVQEPLSGVIATPRVETHFGFLPDYPEVLLSQGSFNKVDTLRGYDFGEFSFLISDPEDDGLTRDEFESNFSKLKDINNLVYFNEILQLTENEYIGNVTSPLTIRSQLGFAITDVLFSAPELMELTQMMAVPTTTTKQYLYEFDFRLRSLNNPLWMKAVHGEELPFVFLEEPPITTVNGRQLAETVQTMWTNFAKSGDPTAPMAIQQGGEYLRWAEYTNDGLEMMRIDNTSTMTSFPRPWTLHLYEDILHYVQRESDPVIVG